VDIAPRNPAREERAKPHLEALVIELQVAGGRDLRVEDREAEKHDRLDERENDEGQMVRNARLLDRLQKDHRRTCELDPGDAAVGPFVESLSNDRSDQESAGHNLRHRQGQRRSTRMGDVIGSGCNQHQGSDRVLRHRDSSHPRRTSRLDGQDLFGHGTAIVEADRRMPKAAPHAGVRRALSQKQLVLFYQPIHELKSRRIVAAEALLRARRGSGEIRSATSIAVGAEDMPELFRLDSWIMQQAFRDAEKWDGIRLHVNLSPREFEDGHLARRLRKSSSDISKVTLEITEISFIKKLKQTERVLEDIRSLGVQLWLDDFGTGHSSISHLLEFDLDGVKVPATFIKHLNSNKRCRTITLSIIKLAHDLGLKVIAEGVEHKQQLEFLRDAKCEYVQGFLFSEPMAAGRLESALERFGTSGQ
jgi:EAL domain-containing protein (putative c-di-GMP-specific phosphodiesterase class I)